MFEGLHSRLDVLFSIRSGLRLSGVIRLQVGGHLLNCLDKLWRRPLGDFQLLAVQINQIRLRVFLRLFGFVFNAFGLLLLALVGFRGGFFNHFGLGFVSERCQQIRHSALRFDVHNTSLDRPFGHKKSASRALAYRPCRIQLLNIRYSFDCSSYRFRFSLARTPVWT